MSLGNHVESNYLPMRLNARIVVVEDVVAERYSFVLREVVIGCSKDLNEYLYVHLSMHLLIVLNWKHRYVEFDWKNYVTL